MLSPAAARRSRAAAPGAPLFTRRITLFRLAGFDVKVDLSWVLLALLLTWALAELAYGPLHPELPVGTRWGMGVLGAFGLFGSIVLHELAHSLVARREGIRIRGITLFFFGGVAELEEEPPTARSELLMAIAGPAASFVLAGLFFGLWLGARAVALPAPASHL